MEGVASLTRCGFGRTSVSQSHEPQEFKFCPLPGIVCKMGAIVCVETFARMKYKF